MMYLKKRRKTNLVELSYHIIFFYFIIHTNKLVKATFCSQTHFGAKKKVAWVERDFIFSFSLPEKYFSASLFI